MKPQLIQLLHEGDENSCPISRDSPNITSPQFLSIKAIYGTKGNEDRNYDQSFEAQAMMKGEYNKGVFTHISIPFSSSSPMKGAYICLHSQSWTSPPSHLIFTLTSSKGEKTSKKYEFPEFKGFYWFFLPVDLSDVVFCEITGKGRNESSGACFGILSLFFFRKETHDEILVRKAREKQWYDAPIIKSEFVKEADFKSLGRNSIPIPRGNPMVIKPSFSRIIGKCEARSKESKEYDQSSNARRMLKGEDYVSLSHLSIPFPSPNPMKGAYICVDEYSSPSLLFTFTDCDGKKTSKKYEFTKPKHYYEWHFLPIDLDNVVLCEIEGEGRWKSNNCRCFNIYCLVYTMPEETIAAERLSLLPWK
ncbi:hypothetical protein ADUPG1_007442 [Aduncisulcus paluster]|uniref:Uncharacterized protein n=1 Tax=Aduncisulcus paluster TaxID=2918883 RepID=A0ABQ5KM79_9EUKA|nr:hypothetical protein ADUPG1_007442 [Aduncisulcus paluster]